MPIVNKNAAGPWPCEAYGPDGASAGALCFLAPAGKRACGSLPECETVMGVERQRVFRRINELAAQGNPDFEHLADEFTTPEQLLGGDDERGTAH